MKDTKPIQKGTLRITYTNPQVKEWTGKTWKKSGTKLPAAMDAIRLFKKQGNLKLLKDTKIPRFVKGQLSRKGTPHGARITVTPTGEKLDGAYSLFSDQLTIHDQPSNDHWDVLYKTATGWAHRYTQKKRKKLVEKKYDAVHDFDTVYKKLVRRAKKQLSDRKDSMALPLYTLLLTHMRVGSEIYYHKTHHKGLTTLKKSDITVRGKQVTFSYRAKDGIPMTITKTVPVAYSKRLRAHLAKKGKNDFVFTGETGKPLRDTDFMHAFEHYCGHAFYPHIVRSHYATERVADFLKTHKHAEMEEVRELFTSIAHELGHKKFDKKQRTWTDSYTVTIHHYVKPSLVENVRALVP
jgi:hypothetical protein